MQLVVARIARPRGLDGELALDLRTDRPAERLAAGTQVSTVPASAGPLTIVRARLMSGRWYVAFEEAQDRTSAEALRGVEIVVEIDDDESSEADADEDAWYPHELAGLRAEHVDGRLLGTVVGLEYMPAQDLLLIAEPSGARSLVPFVRAIVPVVDVAGGRVVLDPPTGLLADEPGVPDEVRDPGPTAADPADGAAPRAADPAPRAVDPTDD